MINTTPHRPITANLQFPEIGYFRLKQIVAPHGLIPVSKSTWWSWVSRGLAPKPIKLSKRITAWKASEVYELLNSYGKAGNSGEAK